MSECEHESYEAVGTMEPTPVDGVYVIPCRCLECREIIYEKYYYEGMITDKEDPEG